jgi:IS4 transposase
MSTLLLPDRQLRSFLNYTKSLPNRFQRSRIWSPQSVMVWLLLITFPDRKCSYRGALRVLKRFGMQTFGWTKMPCSASICRARRKMTTPMCREVLKTITDRCHANMPTCSNPYGKRRFIAFDGTRLVTRRSKDTAYKLLRFSTPSGGRVHNPQALAMVAIDVFRRLPLDWVVVGKGVGERTAIVQLLSTLALVPGDIAIMDRGLPNRVLFAELLARGVDLVARMSASETTGWSEVTEFLKTGKLNGTITFQVGERSDLITLRARIVERAPKKGRPLKGCVPDRMVILTTLKEEDGFSRSEIIKIYGSRWGIESLFKELKSFMHVEPFHSKRVDGVEQELAAAFIWMALGSSIQAEAEAPLAGRRVYRTDCLRTASDLLGDLLQGRPIEERMNDYIKALQYFSYTPRPGRHAPRECKMPFGRSVQRGPR